MLKDFIANEADKAGEPLELCVVGGSSQGGFLSLALVGKTGAPRYAGVQAICCGHPGAPQSKFDLSEGSDRPALFQWETMDPVIGPDAPAEVISSL